MKGRENAQFSVFNVKFSILNEVKSLVLVSV